MSVLPAHFLWGAATCAAQIEGAVRVDGRAESIWDVFARIPGAIADGSTPEVACDHFHRYGEDVALLRHLGVDAYRFSVSWPRVLRDDGAVNHAGLDFYSRLVDRLLESGIRPWLTLYHWDLPQSVEGAGGWAERATADRFADYARVVAEALGDRVRDWTTFNEPFCSALLGYAAGVHAPGRRDPCAALAAVHHQHLAHGLAVRVLRDAGLSNVGITLNLSTGIPADRASEVDREAAEHFEMIHNGIFLDPVLRADYPERAWQTLGPLGLDAVVRDGDLASIAQPLDFLGVNYYHDDSVSGRIASDSIDPHARGGASPWIGINTISFPSRQLPRTAMGWEVHPDGLRSLLVRLSGEYPRLPPLYVTENGAAYDDTVAADGLVHDDAREQYLLDHIAAVERAVDAGVDVRGYFAWSLLDNFEWAYGYGKRFGLIHVDFDSLVRTPKSSAHAYAERIARCRR